MISQINATGMVFIDSNIPMYLIGASHPLKDRSKLILGELVRSKRRLVTSAEVLQELCHRYGAIHKLDFLQPAFDVLYGLVDQVFPVTKEDVEASKTLVLGYKNLSARDALHVAVMKNLGIQDLLSFDKDFDRFSWIRRIS